VLLVDNVSVILFEFVEFTLKTTVKDKPKTNIALLISVNNVDIDVYTLSVNIIVYVTEFTVNSNSFNPFDDVLILLNPIGISTDFK
jgi:hypothetical protein